MSSVGCLAATGMLGSGFQEASLRAGLSLGPSFIGCDAGSSDFGPYYLGSGKSHFSDAVVERDLRLMLLAGHEQGIPVIVGSAGTAGLDAQVEHLAVLVGRIARGAGLRLRAATIRTELDPAMVASLHARGGLRPLSAGGAAATTADIAACSHVVGVAGAEPIIEALGNGADVVIVGRCTDAAIFAAVPLLHGVAPGPAWHAGKLLECGTACTVRRRRPDCLFARVDDDGFSVLPPDGAARCSPVSVAAHNLYETRSPFELHEPGGTLDTTACEYLPEGDRGVRVSGSVFRPSAHGTVKLEGARLASYQSVFLGTIRDPVLLAELDPWLDDLSGVLAERLAEIAGAPSSAAGWSLRIRRLGVDAAMGAAEPTPRIGHEVGLLVEVDAPEQELARTLADVAAHMALHHPVERWTGLVSNLALPYSPAVLDRGPVYEFVLDHVIDPADPANLFTREMTVAA